MPSTKVTLMLLRAGDHVQVGEDDALVDDHHAGADAALHFARRLVGFGRLALGEVAAALLVWASGGSSRARSRPRAPPRAGSCLVRPWRPARAAGVLQRAQHGGVDVLLRELADVAWRGHSAMADGRTTPTQQGEQQREAAPRRAASAARRRPVRAQPGGCGRRRTRLGRSGLAPRPCGAPGRAAVEGRPAHRCHLNVRTGKTTTR